MRAFLRRLWSHVWFTDAYFGRINREMRFCEVCGWPFLADHPYPHIERES